MSDFLKVPLTSDPLGIQIKATHMIAGLFLIAVWEMFCRK